MQKIWESLERADGLNAGSTRSSLLLGVIDAADSGLVKEGRRARPDSAVNEDEGSLLVARATALAMLAYDDPRHLDAAQNAFAATHDANGPSLLVRSHLAEALLKYERNTEALDVAAPTNVDELEEQDLHWRVVRLDQIRAASLIRLGRLLEAELAVKRINRQLANEDDFEFLPAPTELAAGLLEEASGSEAAEAKRLLRLLTENLDVSTWFPEDIRSRLLALTSSESQENP